MTTLMENSMVAQNTCLQMCVVGRDSFIGAGCTFTDFNLVPKPIRTFYKDRLVEIDLPVLGSCVGTTAVWGRASSCFRPAPSNRT